MPRPGSHHYDIRRSRLRRRYEDEGIPDEKAEERANEQLQEVEGNPPRRWSERGEGPQGER